MQRASELKLAARTDILLTYVLLMEVSQHLRVVGWYIFYNNYAIHLLTNVILKYEHIFFIYLPTVIHLILNKSFSNLFLNLKHKNKLYGFELK